MGIFEIHRAPGKALRAHTLNEMSIKFAMCTNLILRRSAVTKGPLDPKQLGFSLQVQIPTLWLASSLLHLWQHICHW